MSRLIYSDALWASVLQWSRLGVNAAIFLVAARYLSLAEIGAFATAAAPLRFFQVVHKSGIEDSVVISSEEDQGTIDVLFALSICLAVTVVVATLALSMVIGPWTDPAGSVGAMMTVLSLANILQGFGAVPDGLLRRACRFRGLALRSLGSQSLAAVVTLAALNQGAGAWALVAFSVSSSGFAAAISWRMAGWRPTANLLQWSEARPVFASVMGLSGRVLIGASVQPVLQIAIGAGLGLSAAGVWQIAIRIMAMLEAITVAPLRFLALPRFSSLISKGSVIRDEIMRSLSLAGMTTALVYLGTYATAPDLMVLFVGTAHGELIVAVIRLLCLGGLAAAISAIGNQALIASGQIRPTLLLSLSSAAITFVLAAPMLLVSVASVAACQTLAAFLIAGLMLITLRRAFGIGIMPALWSVGAPYLAGTLMAVVVIKTAGQIPFSAVAMRLIIQIVLGAIVFASAMKLLVWASPGKFDVRPAT